ncbi:hypothetical protein [Nocardioides cynanchi]|uniref:hypothetical protein n=1 Tax=Nocardioides cynanchi TaxID=2558918 RepID=UPI00124811F9|nr:hypothetical protein [Nocardioides cynanchi]
MTGRLLPRPAAALLACVALLLTGCSGSGSSSPQTGPGSSGGSPASSQTGGGPTGTGSSLPAPKGITVTPPGTSLKVGQAATVAWQPNQKTVGAIKMAVTSQEQVPISTFRDFRLDRATRRSTAYFVHVSVKNLGRSDLSHVPVPLYLLDHQHTLLQASTFQAKFPACPSRPLPAKFKRGSHTTVCLVYFVPKHGKLVAMSFRPSESYDAITWHGAVHRPKSHHQHQVGKG